jgi:hypothetical protein
MKLTRLLLALLLAGGLSFAYGCDDNDMDDAGDNIEDAADDAGDAAEDAADDVNDAVDDAVDD